MVNALVAQRIERYPAEVEVVGSNPAKRAIFVLGRLAQLVRALALHARGHWFESSTAHHFILGGLIEITGPSKEI